MSENTSDPTVGPPTLTPEQIIALIGIAGDEEALARLLQECVDAVYSAEARAAFWEAAVLTFSPEIWKEGTKAWDNAKLQYGFTD